MNLFKVQGNTTNTELRNVQKGVGMTYQKFGRLQEKVETHPATAGAVLLWSLSHHGGR
jgi:hypothetical protein